MSQPRLEFLDPSELDDNPANWKFHPPDQLSSIGELIGELGWLKPLVYNERTKRLIDGHGRKQVFAGRGKVPVYVVDLEPTLELKAVATLDPLGWTAVSDKSKFDALLKSSKLLDSTKDGVRKLLEGVSRASTLLDPKPTDPERPDESDEVTLAMDSIWPSDNEFGVPTLDVERQARSVPYPVWTWGSIGHARPMPGTWHFYTADQKFEPLWRRPDRVFKSGPGAIVEPNFSTTDQMPIAAGLWAIYRKRWLARYWQSRGLCVFVDLNVDANLNCLRNGIGRCPLNLLGVPRTWSSFASRAHAGNADSLIPEWEVAKEWAASESPLFLVVGGGKQVKKLAQEKGWVWVPEQIQQIRERGES